MTHKTKLSMLLACQTQSSGNYWESERISRKEDPWR